LLLSEVRSSHGLSSGDSPYIRLSQDREVAEYFARGPKQDQAGFVSEFRIEQREFESIATRNYENPQAWFEPNPFI
jgi:hypothetical protein